MRAYTLAPMGIRTVRGDAVLLCVEPGGGEWRNANVAERIAAGAVVAEAALRGAVSVDRDRLVPGTSGESALARLAAEVAGKGKARKVSDWLGEVQDWALDAVVQELAAGGVARPAIGRKWGSHRQIGLEVLDPAAQERAARTVREAAAETGNPTPDVTVVLLILAAAGGLRHVAPEAAVPLVSRWFTGPRGFRSAGG